MTSLFLFPFPFLHDNSLGLGSKSRDQWSCQYLAQARKTQQEVLADRYNGLDGEGIPKDVYNPDSKELVMATVGVANIRF